MALLKCNCHFGLLMLPSTSGFEYVLAQLWPHDNLTSWRDFSLHSRFLYPFETSWRYAAFKTPPLIISIHSILRGSVLRNGVRISSLDRLCLGIEGHPRTVMYPSRSRSSGYWWPDLHRDTPGPNLTLARLVSSAVFRNALKTFIAILSVFCMNFLLTCSLIRP